MVITGFISPTGQTNEPRSIWVESDLVVRLRIASEPTPETAEPSDLLERADFSAISYKVYREVDGVDALVEGYESVAVTINDAIPANASLPRDWGKDGVGYNFRHVVPAAAFAANATHRVVYRFVTSGDSVTTQHCVTVHVQGPTGDTASAGSGTVTGDPGEAGPGYAATSSTSFAIGTGSKSFTTQSGLAYSSGARVRISSAADTSNWMEGLVTSYIGTALVVDVTETHGSGTHADWNINLAGEPGSGGDSFVYTFDVTRSPYNATGDGTTDDSAALQAAIDAADAYTAANTLSKAIVWIPDGVFICEGVTVGASGESNRISVLGNGTLKLKAGSAEHAVLFVAGNYNRVEGITIDGNAAGSPSGRGEGLRVTGSYNTISGVTSQNTKTTGSTGATFVDWTASQGNLFTGCISLNSGWVGFRNGGDNATFRDCKAIEHADNGLSGFGGEKNSILIDGFTFSSSVDNLGTCGILLDQGDDDYTGYMIKHATIRGVRGYMAAAGGTFIPIKVAHIHNCVIEDFWCDHDTAVSSVKIAEAIGKLTIRDSYFPYVIDQDPVGDGTGSVSAMADNGGFVQFTSTAHLLTTNAYVVITGTTDYDGLHMVTAATADTFTTNRKWVSSGGSGVEFFEVAGEIHLENVTVGDRVFNVNGGVSGIRASVFTMKNCALRGYRRYAVGLDNVISTDSVFDRIEIDGCYFESNESSTQPWLLAWDVGVGTGGGQILDSNVTRIGNDNTIVDVGSQTTQGVRGNTPVKTLTVSTTLSGADCGKTLLIGAADLTITLPNVLVVGSGVKYTFVMTSAGLSASTGLAISPQAGDYIALSRVSPGVNDKDLQLTGANDAIGDCVTLISDNTLGWYAIAASGRWTIESDTDVLGDRKVLISGTGVTLTPEQSGTCIIVAAADLTYTLPATMAGIRYTFFLGSGGLSAGTGLSISPNAVDRIFLPGITAADDKDIILAGSGDVHGDSITIVGDGSAGWYVESFQGIWSRET